MNKTFKYKGFVCYWNKEEERYELYSKEEWGYGKGYRTPEWDAGTVDECKEWIDGYWEDEDTEITEAVDFKHDPNWEGNAEDFDEAFENKYFPKIKPKKVWTYKDKYFCFDNGILYLIYKNEDEMKAVGGYAKAPWRVMDSINLSTEEWEEDPQYWMSKYAGDIDAEGDALVQDFLKYEVKESRKLNENEEAAPMVVGTEYVTTGEGQDALDGILYLIQQERGTIKSYLSAVDTMVPMLNYDELQIINEIIADEQQHVKLLSKLYDNLAQDRYKDLPKEEEEEIVRDTLESQEI